MKFGIKSKSKIHRVSDYQKTFLIEDIIQSSSMMNDELPDEILYTHKFQ